MKKIYFFLLFYFLETMSYASTEESMPWDTTLSKVVDAISGPTARIIGVGSVLILGAGFLLTEGGTPKNKVFGVLVGLSIMFNASWIVTAFFGAGALL